MADDIIQKIILEGSSEVARAGKEIEEALTKSLEAVKAVAEGISFSSVTTALVGVVGAVGVVTAGFFELAKSSAETTVNLHGLANAAGASVEEMTATVGALRNMGAETDNLERIMGRLDQRVGQIWPSIAQSVRGAQDQIISNNLAVAQSSLKIEEADRRVKASAIDLANVQKNTSLQAIANAQSVAEARLGLQEAIFNLSQIDDPDPEGAKEIARERAVMAVQRARLQLAQQIQKQKEDAQKATLARAEAEQKAADAELERERAALDLSEKRRKAQEDQANSIANLVKAVELLSSGSNDALLKVNITAENILKGIVASIGPSLDQLKQFKGGVDGIAGSTPASIEVLKKLADVFHGLHDETLKMDIARQLFGRGVGVEFVTALSKGSGALQEMVDRQKALGLATTGNVHTAEEFHHSLNTLTSDIGIIAKQFGALFQPAFITFFKNLDTALTNNRERILAWGESIANSAGPVFETFIRVLVGAPDAVKDKWLTDFIEKIKAFGKAVDDVLTGGVIPVFKTLIAIMDDIATALNGVFGANLTGIAVLLGLWVAKVLGIFGILTGGLTFVAAFLKGLFAEIAVAMELSLVGLIGRLGVIVSLFIAFLATIKSTTVGSSEMEKKIDELQKLKLSAEEFQTKLNEIQKQGDKGDSIGSPAMQQAADGLTKKIDEATRSVHEHGAAQVAEGNKSTSSINETANSVKNLNNTIQIFKGGKLFEDTVRSAEDLRNKIQIIRGTKIFDSEAVDGAKRSIDLLSGSIETLGKNVRTVSPSFETIRGQIDGNLKDLDSIGEKIKEAFATRAPTDFEKVIRDLNETLRVNKDTWEEIDALSAGKPTAGKPGSIDAGKDALSTVEKIQDFFTTLNANIAELVKNSSGAFSDVDKGVRLLADDASQALRELDQLNSNTDRFKNLPESSNIEDRRGESAGDPRNKAHEATSAITEAFNQLGQDIASILNEIAAMSEQTFQAMSETAVGAVNQLKDSFSGLGDRAGEQIDAISEKLAAMIQLLEAAASAAASISISGGGGGSGDSGEGFIEGGLFRGNPGIDSNLAWLSDLEYIMKPQAVQHYGVDWMHKVNAMALPKFNDGGLARAIGNRITPQRFNSGGLIVGSSLAGSSSEKGGRAVILQLAGQDFPLSGPTRIVDQLEKEAIMAGVVDTGTPRR